MPTPDAGAVPAARAAGPTREPSGEEYVVTTDTWGVNPEYVKGDVVVDDGSCPYDIEHAIKTGVLVPVEEPAPALETEARAASPRSSSPQPSAPDPKK